MSAATNWLEDRILQAWMTDIVPYVGLWTADPGDDPGQPLNSAREVSGGGYVRKPARFNVQNGVATLAEDLTWSNMPAVTVGAVVIYDAPTGGNAILHGPLVAAKTVGAGDAFSLPASNLSVSCD